MFLVLPLAIIIFVLERVSSALFLVNTNRSWRYGDKSITFYGPTSNGSDDYDYIDVDVRINIAPTSAIIAICLFAFVISVVGVCGIWELRRVEGTARHQRVWSWTILLTNFATAAACIGILAWASVLQGKEGWKSYADVGKEDQRWTRETWVCQINQYFGNNDWSVAACGVAKATRFMLIPLAVASLLVILSAWTLIHDRGGLSWLFGGKGRYGGFDSVYEMRPQAPERKDQNAAGGPVTFV
jgi:hypothetical protein